MYDIAIVGAGPAGLTAAIYALRMNLKIAVFEASTFGGQIANAAKIENYPGVSSVSGFEFAMNLYQQAINLGMEMINEKICLLENIDNYFILGTESNSYKAKSVILAMGVKRRLLNIPGEQELKGKGVSYCATCDGAFFRNKDVAVIGGGNTALGESIHLSNLCNKVYLIHRRDTFRGNQKLMESVKNNNKIEIITNVQTSKILGEDKVNKLILIHNTSDEKIIIDVSGVFVAIGQDPDTEIVQNLVELDNDGYIIANENCETSISGVFVAGDCRTKTIRQLTTATADGTVAAINASKYLE